MSESKSDGKVGRGWFIEIIIFRGYLRSGTGTASIRVKDINDMPPQFTKEEWFTEVDETEGPDLPEMPILTVTVHDEDETNKFQYKVRSFLFDFFGFTDGKKEETGGRLLSR